jgi:hypothetical protein
MVVCRRNPSTTTSRQDDANQNQLVASALDRPNKNPMGLSRERCRWIIDIIRHFCSAGRQARTLADFDANIDDVLMLLILLQMWRAVAGVHRKAFNATVRRVTPVPGDIVSDTDAMVCDDYTIYRGVSKCMNEEECVVIDWWVVMMWRSWIDLLKQILVQKNPRKRHWTKLTTVRP